MFDQVAVWLDDLAPDRGAFGQGLAWAKCLRLPLCGFTRQTAGAPPVEVLDQCADACRRHGVDWEVRVEIPDPSASGSGFGGPGRLCVFGRYLPAARREELLRRSAQGPGAAALVCPQTGARPERILILNQRRDPAGAFLTEATRVCHAFQIAPVVLTVARSEREAQLRQQLAEETLAALDLPGEFDFIVGSDFAAAVTLDAHWRHCTHVILECDAMPSWWHWWRGDLMRRLLDRAGDLTCLALPQRKDGLPWSPSVGSRRDRTSEPAAFRPGVQAGR